LSKRKKKSGYENELVAKVLNLITALVNLVIAILILLEKLSE
jgi:hypothetical protein